MAWFARGLALLWVLVLAPGAAMAQPATVEYLGNEGLFVVQGETKVLFDPFYEESFAGDYTLVPDDTLAQVMAPGSRYDGVTAVFVSHIHPDHFSSQRAIDYLRSHPRARLFSTREVFDAIRAAGVRSTDPLMAQLQSIDLRAGDPPQRFTHGELEIEAYPLAHTGRRSLDHLAFRVTLAGRTTVMHLGDADGADAVYAPHQTEFDRTPLDALFAPEWLLVDDTARTVLETRLRPRAIYGVHFFQKRPRDASTGGHAVFETPGETRDVGQ